MKGYIYKIKCNDENITDFYIGSTIDIYARINNHYYSYKNNKQNIFKLYTFIKNNGSFSNFYFSIIYETCFYSLYELRLLESKLIFDEKPSLNTTIPSVSNIKKINSIISNNLELSNIMLNEQININLKDMSLSDSINFYGCFIYIHSFKKGFVLLNKLEKEMAEINKKKCYIYDNDAKQLRY
jgi:hypothetical protein